MSSKLYQEVNWTCPKCSCNNTNTFLDIETQPVECVSCKKSFDIYLKVSLDIEVLNVSDGTVSEKDKKAVMNGLRRASDAGKIDKLEALQLMSEINSIPQGI